MNGQRPERAAAARRLGEALRGLQQRSGCTLRALESQVPISDSSLSRYFLGRTVPPWPVVLDLCRVLGGDPSEYRALWEAADRARPDGPDGDAPPTVAQASAPVQGRRLPQYLSGRWAFAAVGGAIGLAIGLLTLLGLQDSPKGTGIGYGDAGVVVHNAEEKCQKPRTLDCALHLAWDPYRPYMTANSGERVWHEQLLHGRCRVADGVTVTDENGKHSSIWIQVTEKGQRLWLPGIRVDPNSLNQVSTLLPRCPT
ncbi:helix-turn-helix transcriptional regulator [Streptomyces sp. NPDC006872]|uniref:helix-turn-helix domain-containing protein n=1 Tax=Streptomyces sp. NPDC006872 TaxID=3155720 RepID=UPI0033C89E68